MCLCFLRPLTSNSLNKQCSSCALGAEEKQCESNCDFSRTSRWRMPLKSARDAVRTWVKEWVPSLTARRATTTSHHFCGCYTGSREPANFYSPPYPSRLISSGSWQKSCKLVHSALGVFSYFITYIRAFSVEEHVFFFPVRQVFVENSKRSTLSKECPEVRDLPRRSGARNSWTARKARSLWTTGALTLDLPTVTCSDQESS